MMAQRDRLVGRRAQLHESCVSIRHPGEQCGLEALPHRARNGHTQFFTVSAENRDGAPWCNIRAPNISSRMKS
jgi:hypothetical protein